MFTVIGDDGKEYGPASVAQLQAWMAAKRVNLDTKAKAQGSEEWRRLGDYAEFSPPDGTPPVLGVAVPARPPLTGTPAEIAATLIANARPLEVLGCISRSFELWKANFLPLVGATLLVILAQGVSSMIPLLGAIAGMALNGVWYGGLYYYYLGKMRGEPREVGDAFAGFSKAFVPLMLTTLLVTGLTLALLVPFLAPWGAYVMKHVMHGGGSGPPPMPGALLLTTAAIGGLVLMYFSLSWVFGFALVIDRGLGPWTALEVSRRVVAPQWFRVFFALFLGGIVTMLGLIGLFIGIFFTLPLMFGTLLYAYEDLFNAPRG